MTHTLRYGWLNVAMLVFALAISFAAKDVRATASGTLPPTLAPPTQISPVTGTTGLISPVTITWGTVTGASAYVAQVSISSTIATVSFTVQSTTTSTQLPPLAAGTLYYWRVGAIGGANSAGTVNTSVAWSTIWSFTTAPPLPLPAPTLVSPKNGTSGVTSPATLTWNAVTGAAGYVAQVSIHSDLTSCITAQSTTTSVVLPPLAAGTKYYWRVYAVAPQCAAPCTAIVLSAVWCFITAPPAPLPAPTLVAPVNGATGVLNPVTLSWKAVTGAAGYTIQFLAGTNTATITTLQSTTTSILLPALTANTLYAWRVSANGPAVIAPCTTVVWSAYWTFTTAPPQPPAAPVLLTPKNGTSGLASPVTLTWNAVTGATGYLAQVSISTTFSNMISAQSTTTSVQLPPLAANTKYYWHVCATSPVATATILWSTTWCFTTAPPVTPVALPAPVLVSPANLAIGVASPYVLIWNAVTGAAGYEVQISTSSSFANVAITTSTTTSLKLSTLAANTLYYWRVAAIGQSNAAGTVSSTTVTWSAPWSFTTS